MSRSLRQRLQSQINGANGGRPPKPVDPHGQAAVRRIKARARLRGGAALHKVVRLWVDLVQDATARPADRMKAAENLADRFGLPRLQSTADVADVFATPKLIVYRQFEPPSTFNPEPPRNDDDSSGS